jgi:hypothetical protein
LFDILRVPFSPPFLPPPFSAPNATSATEEIGQLIDDALVPIVICLLATACHAHWFVPPRHSTALRAAASLHGALFVMATFYALLVGHFTVGMRPDHVRLFLIPLFMLFAAGLFSVIASFHMHRGHKALYLSHLFNLPAALFLLLVSVVSITHDGP